MKKFILLTMAMLFSILLSQAQTDSNLLASTISEALNNISVNIDLDKIYTIVEKNMSNALTAYNDDGSKEEQLTKNYDLKNFSAIGCEGIAQIVFTQSNNYSVKATGTKSFIDNLIMKVENKSLVVRMKKNAKLNSGRNNKNNLTIYISAPKLTSLSLSGVAGFSCKALKGDSFLLSTSGVSKIECPSLEFKKLISKVSGASSTNFNCKAEEVEIINSGASKCNIKLDCEKLAVSNSGVGVIKISGTADKTDIHSSGVSKVDVSDLNKY